MAAVMSAEDLQRQPNPVRVVADDAHPDLPGWHCAGMPAAWYHAMRMKWAHDWSGANALEYALWLEAVDMANANGWRVPTGQERLRRMAGLAIAELADPSRYRQPESWQLKAAWIGVGRSQWFDIWQARYEALYRTLDEWSNRAWRHVRERQQGASTGGDESGLQNPE